jgi:hypothetical protein
MLDRVSKEDFEPLVGKKVKVYRDQSSSDPEGIELEVKEVAAMRSPSPRATEPFRIVLRSRDGWVATQGTFRIEHPALGDLELFAVPIGPDGEGLCYEIIFN